MLSNNKYGFTGSRYPIHKSRYVRNQLLENINFIAKFTQEILGQAILKWNQYQLFSTQYAISPIYLEIFQTDSSISSVGRGTPGPIVRWLNASFVPSEFRPIYHTIVNESRITLTLQKLT